MCLMCLMPNTPSLFAKGIRMRSLRSLLGGIASAVVLVASVALSASPRMPPTFAGGDCAPADTARSAYWLMLRPPVARNAVARAVPPHLTERALARRSLRRTAAGAFDRRDRDIAPDTINEIVSTGARIRRTSRWLHAVSVDATPAQLAALTSLASVESVRPVAQLTRLVSSSDDDESGNNDGVSFYGSAGPQIEQLALDGLHAKGFTGAGVLVGILDTGFRRTHVAFNAPGHQLSVAGEYDFVNDDPVTAPEPGDDIEQHVHGTYILGALGAYLPGTLVGAAYDASFLLAKAEDIEPDTIVEEDYFVAGLEWLEAQGADVATSSLVLFNVFGPEALDGTTSAMSIAFAVAGANGMHCVQAAGNSGHDADPATHHLVIPADAFNTFAVGAVTSAGSITNFSSDGPTVDGRVKPELLARGQQVFTVNPNNDTALATPSGTSLAAPLVAGAIACLVQAHPDWIPRQMRAALLGTASDYALNGEPDPLGVRGFGIVRAVNALTADPAISDLNDDFVVNGADLAIVLAAWGPCAAPVGCAADLTNDGLVNAGDLALLLGGWTGN